MKKIISFLLCFILILPLFSFSQEEDEEDNYNKIRIVVFDFEYSGGFNRYTANALSESFRTKLGEKAIFEVIDRKVVEKAIKEMKFQSTMVKESDPNVIKFGEQLAVKIGVFSSISKTYDKVTINVRVVDMETGVSFINKVQEVPSQNEIRNALDNLAEEITKEAEKRKIKLSEIKKLYARKKYKDALDKMKLYEKYKKPSPASSELKMKIIAEYSELVLKDLEIALDLKKFEAVEVGILEYRDNFGIDDRIQNLEERFKLEKGKEYYKRAKIRYDNGDYEEAYKFAIEAAKSDPTKKEYKELATRINNKLEEKRAKEDIENLKKKQIEEKMKKIKHGGIDIYYNVYIPADNSLSKNPDISGCGLGLMIPFGKNVIFYNRVTFSGINLNGFNFFSFHEGLRFHWTLTTFLDVYFQGGWNITPQSIQVNDNFSFKVSDRPIRFGGFGGEGGIGFKIIILPYFSVFAEALYFNNSYGINYIDRSFVHFNAGISFGLF